MCSALFGNCSMAPCIALFGGTFDPIHLGHLAIAEDVRVALRVDRLVFVPAAQQPFKQGQRITSAEDRLRMVALAIAENPAFALSDREVRRGGLSYTVDTVAEFRADYPDSEIYVVVGSDTARDLPKWRAIDRLVQFCRFAIVRRPGYDVAIHQLAAALKTTQDRLIDVAGPAFDISATEVRERMRTGRPTRYHLPPAVWQFIADHRLYGNTHDTTQPA